MRFAGHGGRCCGITHISGFVWPFEWPRNIEAESSRATNVLNEKISDVLERRYQLNRSFFNRNYTNLSVAEREKEYLKQKARWNCLIECVLTDQQLSSGWDKVLEKRGFKKVTRFLNTNSGNFCNVFHLQTREK